MRHLSKDKYKIIDLFEKNKILKYGNFELSSGEKSKYYVDIKKATTNPQLLKIITEVVVQHLKEKDIRADYIGGVVLGGIPLATAVSLKMELPLLMVRNEKKKYGTKDIIVGTVEKGSSVVLVEDVTTKATSSLPAIKVLREAGLSIKYLVSVVDRESGAVDNLKDVGVELIPLIKSSEILKK